MSAKDFFILHGEKVAVGVVGAVCVFAMWNAFTNRDIRPDVRGVPVDADAIRATISSITDTRNRAIPPKLKPVPTYLDSTKEAFARKLMPAPAMAWLSVHPDLVNIIINSRFFYIYELQAPTIDIKDVIGSLELTVGLPTESRESDERIQDGADESWERNDGEVSINSAAYVGVKIDRKIGAGEWTSLEEGRLWTMEELSQPIVMPGAQASETYAFRARLVARVTGFVADDFASGDVLVHPNRYPGDSSEEGLKKLGAELLAEKPNRELIAAFLKPLPVRGAALGPKERLYEGPSGENRSDSKLKAVITASSPIRFQLDKLEPDPEDPAQSRAVLALTMRVQADGKGAWLDPKTFKPRKFSHKAKDILGGDVVAEDPLKGGNDKFNLTTEFELVSIEKDVKRILYYEIKAKTRSDGQQGKELEIVPREVNTDKIVVRNTKTKAEMTLMKLQRIQRPGAVTAIIYPDLPAFVDEEVEFYKDPANFVQQQQTPEAPKQHLPGAGPLEDLRKAGDNRAKTDTPYYELADGRVVYYEPINKIVKALWIPGREPKAQKLPAESPVGQPPVGQPPMGQPPMGQPQIGMPPGAGAPPAAPRGPTPRPKTPTGARPTAPTTPPMGPGGQTPDVPPTVPQPRPPTR